MGGRWLAKQDVGSPTEGGQGFQFESDVLINTKLPGQKEGVALCPSLKKHVCSSERSPGILPASVASHH